jgi:hypothetical protein
MICSKKTAAVMFAFALPWGQLAEGDHKDQRYIGTWKTGFPKRLFREGKRSLLTRVFSM